MKRFSPYFYLTIIAATFAVLFYFFSGPEPKYCEQPFAERSHDVVMFSTPWCPYCKKARRFFVDNQVAYCEYNVESSPENQDVFTELGGSGVPLIIIGEDMFYGFAEEGIKKSLIQQGLLP